MNFISSIQGVRAFRIPVLLLTILLWITACGGGGKPAQEIGDSLTPQIIVVETGSENIFISSEPIDINTCGDIEVSRKIERKHSIAHSIDVSAGLTVSADGKVKIPEFGELGVGAAVAANYQVGYGSQDSVSESITISAPGNKHVQVTINHYEVWETGNVVVVAGNKSQEIPYSFRRGFTLEQLEPVTLSNCDTSPVLTVGDTSPPPSNTEAAVEPVETPVVQVETPTEARSKLAVSPLGNECKPHVSNFCGLDIEVQWKDIQSENGNIYVFGYAPNFGPNNSPLWWVAGSGFLPNSDSGAWVIEDGAFGTPGSRVWIFACQTSQDYILSNAVPKIELATEPSCYEESELLGITSAN